MRRKIGTLALIVVLVVAAFGLGRASAQSAIPDGVFVRDSADNTWLVSGGARSVVPIYEADDADIQALPESGRWVVPASGGLVALGDRPEWGEDPAPIRQKDQPPKVDIRLAADEITRGQTVDIVIAATDDVGLDWIEWEGEVADKHEGIEDPALAAERRFNCEGRKECSNTWTIPTTGVGEFVVVARARDDSGQRSEATADLTIRP
jgi:hypothetical protein